MEAGGIESESEAVMRLEKTKYSCLTIVFGGDLLPGKGVPKTVLILMTEQLVSDKFLMSFELGHKGQI